MLDCRLLAQQSGNPLSRPRAPSRSYALCFRFGYLALPDGVCFVPAVAMINVDAPAESFPGDHADCAASLSRLFVTALGHGAQAFACGREEKLVIA